MVFPREISESRKMEVTHAIKGFHRLSIVKNDTVGSGNGKDHIIRLLEESFFRIGFFEKNRTEFAYQNRLFAGFNRKRRFSVVILSEQISTTQRVFGRTASPDSTGQYEHLPIRRYCWSSEK